MRPGASVASVAYVSSSWAMTFRHSTERCTRSVLRGSELQNSPPLIAESNNVRGVWRVLVSNMQRFPASRHTGLLGLRSLSLVVVT